MNKRERTLNLRGQFDFLDEAFRNAAVRYGREDGPDLIGIRDGHQVNEDLQYEEYVVPQSMDSPLARKVTGDRDLLIGILAEAIDSQFDALATYRDDTHRFREVEASEEMGLSIDNPALYEPPERWGNPRYDFYSQFKAVASGLVTLISELMELERIQCSECEKDSWQWGVAECRECGAAFLGESSP
jgi:hypothetical protein